MPCAARRSSASSASTVASAARTGVLAGALAARAAGVGRLIVPSDGAAQLDGLTGLRVVVADHLAQVIARAHGSTGRCRHRARAQAPSRP